LRTAENKFAEVNRRSGWRRNLDILEASIVQKSAVKILQSCGWHDRLQPGEKLSILIRSFSPHIMDIVSAKSRRFHGVRLRWCPCVTLLMEDMDWYYRQRLFCKLDMSINTHLASHSTSYM